MCFPKQFRFTRGAMARFARRKDAVALIAEAGSQEIQGFVIVHFAQNAAGSLGYIVTLDVAPESRRKGVAAALILEAEHRAPDIGATKMMLHVYIENSAAISFYETMGYERMGEELAFYGEAGLDAAVYRKQLARG